jgi:hypothetical protein
MPHPRPAYQQRNMLTCATMPMHAGVPLVVRRSRWRRQHATPHSSPAYKARCCGAVSPFVSPFSSSRSGQSRVTTASSNPLRHGLLQATQLGRRAGPGRPAAVVRHLASGRIEPWMHSVVLQFPLEFTLI